MNTMKNANRLRWLDEVKGLGILLMVIGHAGVSMYLVHWIYGFHMPLFFFLAGYIFDYHKWEKRGFVRLMKSRARAYLLAYLILFMINLAIYSGLKMIMGGYTLTTFLSYLIAGLYSHDTQMPNCAPLWFLTCLFVSYIYFWFIISRENRYKKYIVAVLFVIALLGVCVLEQKVGIDELPWHVDTALAGSVLMFLGSEFKTVLEGTAFSGERVRNSNRIIGLAMSVLCILSTVLIFLNDRVIMVRNQYGNIFLFFVPAILMSLCIIYLFHVESNSWVNSIRKVLAFWGQNTIVFMGFNYVFNLVLKKLFRVFNLEESALFCVVDILIVMGGCSILSAIWNRMHVNIPDKN